MLSGGRLMMRQINNIRIICIIHSHIPFSLLSQLNSFDIYVQTRTKQYNQEPGKATSDKQIDELILKYQTDIAQTGIDMLGERRYQDWYDVKGGNTIAGATYAANLTNAELQIKLNNERLDNQLRELNTLAGTAQTPEERQAG